MKGISIEPSWGTKLMSFLVIYDKPTLTYPFLWSFDYIINTLPRQFYLTWYRSLSSPHFKELSQQHGWIDSKHLCSQSPESWGYGCRSTNSKLLYICSFLIFYHQIHSWATDTNFLCISCHHFFITTGTDKLDSVTFLVNHFCLPGRDSTSLIWAGLRVVPDYIVLKQWFWKCDLQDSQH